MSGRAWRATAMAVVATGLGALTSLPAFTQAHVVRPPECGWAPEEEGGESIPGTGITETVLADSCQVVFTPSGGVRFVLRGTAPDGYQAERAVVQKDDVGRTVVTPSGRINGTGGF